MKYDVHLYYAVRIRVNGVEADSQEHAIELADASIDLDDYLRNGAADDESKYLGVLVDEQDDEDFENTTYYEGSASIYLKEKV